VKRGFVNPLGAKSEGVGSSSLGVVGVRGAIVALAQGTPPAEHQAFEKSGQAFRRGRVKERPGGQVAGLKDGVGCFDAGDAGPLEEKGR
jgi:hypothetical protein